MCRRLSWLRDSADRIGLTQLLAPSLAADPALIDKLAAPVISAIALVAVAAITLVGTFRSSGRTAQVQRDNELDQRADRQNEHLLKEVTRLTELLGSRQRELDDAREALHACRERYVALRMRVRTAGFDPDTIGE